MYPGVVTHLLSSLSWIAKLQKSEQPHDKSGHHGVTHILPGITHMTHITHIYSHNTYDTCDPYNPHDPSRRSYFIVKQCQQVLMVREKVSVKTTPICVSLTVTS